MREWKLKDGRKILTFYLSEYKRFRFEDKGNAILFYVGRVWDKMRSFLYINHTMKSEPYNLEKIVYKFEIFKVMSVVMTYIVTKDNNQDIHIVCDEKREEGCPRIVYARFFKNVDSLRITDLEVDVYKLLRGKDKFSTFLYRTKPFEDKFWITFDKINSIGIYKVGKLEGLLKEYSGSFEYIFIKPKEVTTDFGIYAYYDNNYYVLNSLSKKFLEELIAEVVLG